MLVDGLIRYLVGRLLLKRPFFGSELGAVSARLI